MRRSHIRRLDPEAGTMSGGGLVQSLFAALQEVNRQGMTILLVEQNVRHTLAMAHRGYVLENGRIVLEGPGPELLANQYVRAAYLGL